MNVKLSLNGCEPKKVILIVALAMFSLDCIEPQLCYPIMKSISISFLILSVLQIFSNLGFRLSHKSEKQLI